MEGKLKLTRKRKKNNKFKFVSGLTLPVWAFANKDKRHFSFLFYILFHNNIIIIILNFLFILQTNKC